MRRPHFLLDVLEEAAAACSFVLLLFLLFLALHLA